MRVVSDDKLRKFVEEKLLDDQSPSAIAGRISNQESFAVAVSKDSIYRYIKNVHGRKIEAYRQKKKQLLHVIGKNNISCALRKLVVYHPVSIHKITKSIQKTTYNR